MQSLACSRSSCPASLGQFRRPLVSCAVHAAHEPGFSEQPAGTCRSHPQSQAAPSDAQCTAVQPVSQPLSGGSVGAQLLQQRPQQPHPSLGMMMLQQPYLPLPQQQPRQPPQPQPPRQLSTPAGRPSPPAALTAADGYLVSHTGRYSSPEALQLRGLVRSEPSLDELEQAVLQMSPEAVAAAAQRAAAAAADLVAPGLLAGDRTLEGCTYSGSRPQLFLALQAVVADAQAQASTSEHRNSSSSSTSSSDTGSSRLPQRRRRRTSTSSVTPVSDGTAEGRASDEHTSSKGGAYSNQSSSDRHARQDSSTPSFQQQQQTEQQEQHHQQQQQTGQQQQQQQQQQHHRQSPAAASGTGAVAPASDADMLQRLHEGLAERGLALNHVLGFGQHRLVCPVCEGGRSNEKSLAITLQEPSEENGTASVAALWICHRATCGVQGGFSLPCLPSRAHSSASSSRSSTASMEAVSGSQDTAVQVAPKPLPAQCAAQLQPLSSALLAWLVGERRISHSVLSRNRVAGVAGSQAGPAIAFPYYCCGVLVNIKFRSLSKSFWQVKGGQQVFYGVDDLQGADEAIIVEGELDKLAVETALPHSTHSSSTATAILSLPAGALPAPKPGQQPSPDSKKLACVDSAAAQLRELRRIIIAVDGDGPDQGTADSLLHKLRLLQQRQHGSQQGAPQQLLYLPWPTAAGGEGVLRRVAQQAAAQGLHVDLAAAAGCKDANDVLRACGPEFLRLYISHAQLV